MNRRRVLQSFGLLGLAGLTGGGWIGYRWNLFVSTPGLELLDQKTGLLRTIVDLIIPETDSPGAAAANVHEYIILMVKDCTDRRSQINFIEGLKDLEAFAMSETGVGFETCDQTTQVSILKEFEQRGKPLPGLFGKAKHKFFGRSFFTLLKKYTVLGYFTSREGATRALAYLPVPGKRLGCVELSEYPKCWATE